MCFSPSIFRRLEGCGWNSSSHRFSTAFTQRSATCIYDSQGLGYWRDQNYAIRGTYSTLGTIAGGISLSMCAQQCSALKGCTAFRWGSECVLVGGSFADICDLQQPGCSAPFATGSFYSADFDKNYCGHSVKKLCMFSRVLLLHEKRGLFHERVRSYRVFRGLCFRGMHSCSMRPSSGLLQLKQHVLC